MKNLLIGLLFTVLAFVGGVFTGTKCPVVHDLMCGHEAELCCPCPCDQCDCKDCKCCDACPGKCCKK